MSVDTRTKTSTLSFSIINIFLFVVLDLPFGVRYLERLLFRPSPFYRVMFGELVGGKG